MTNLNELYDLIVENGIATEAELDLITCINGWNEEAMNDVIYVRTGYRSIEQFLGEDEEDEEDEEIEVIEEIDWEPTALEAEMLAEIINFED